MCYVEYHVEGVLCRIPCRRCTISNIIRYFSAQVPLSPKKNTEDDDIINLDDSSPAKASAKTPEETSSPKNSGDERESEGDKYGGEQESEGDKSGGEKSDSDESDRNKSDCNLSNGEKSDGSNQDSDDHSKMEHGFSGKQGLQYSTSNGYLLLNSNRNKKEM